MQRRKKLVASVISDLATDQRVQRICNTLQSLGFDVHVIARSFNDSLPIQEYSFSAHRINCIFRKGFLQYAEFNLRLFFCLLFTKKDILLANDLDTLLPNYLVSKIFNKSLVYDTHEYFTGVAELRNAPLRKGVWKAIENFIFPRLKTVYTVNESIRKLYYEEYGNAIGIVRNVPVSKNVAAAEMPVHWIGKKIVILQGGGINRGRGGLESLEAMKYLPERFLLLIVGSGTEWEEIKTKRIEWQLQDKCEMMDKVLPDRLNALTKLAWVGLSPDKKEDINFLYVLPNKIFDYVHASVPVIASDNPEVKNIVMQYNCGTLIDNVSGQEIANAILKLEADKALYNLLRNNCTLAAEELCWENESKKITEIYKPYL